MHNFFCYLFLFYIYTTIKINSYKVDETKEQIKLTKKDKKLKLYGLNEKIYDYFSQSNNNNKSHVIQYLHYFSNPNLNINIKIENNTLQIIYVEYDPKNKEENNPNNNDNNIKYHTKENIENDNNKIKETNKNGKNEKGIKENNNNNNKTKDEKEKLIANNSTVDTKKHSRNYTLIYHAQVPDKIILNEKKICDIDTLEKNNDEEKDICNVKEIFDNMIEIRKDKDGYLHVKIVPENKELLIGFVGTSLQLISKISSQQKENDNIQESGLLMDTLFWKEDMELEEQIWKEIQKFEIPDLFFVSNIKTFAKRISENNNLKNRIYKGGFIFI